MQISLKGISRRWYTIRYQRKLSREPLLPELDERSVIIFAPEGGIRSHHSTLRHIGQKLNATGSKVLVARCFGCFSKCPTLGMHASMERETPHNSTQICKKCAIDAWRLSDNDGLNTVDLRCFMDSSVDRILESTPSRLESRPHQFEYDGIAFGKLCAIDFALLTKRSEIEDLSPEHSAVMHGLIMTSLTAYLLVDRLCRTVRPKALVYHNDYAMHMSVRLAAEKHGIPVTGVTMAYHCNIDRQKIVFFPKCFPAYAIDVKNAWPAWQKRPLPPKKVVATMDDVLFRIGGRGSHIYSPPIVDSEETVRDLKIDRERKLIVAYTSSLDELIGMRVMLKSVGYVDPGEEQPFRDQIDWLTQLVKWASQHDDLQLIVRVHPREGINHRDSRESDHLGMLRTAFELLPPNCRFVWPEDSISSYGIGELAELVLVSWSTIGIEMARLGLPVLAAFDIAEAPYPKNDFIGFEKDKASYFRRIEYLLRSAPDPEALVNVFRWYNLFNLETSLDRRTNNDHQLSRLWERDKHEKDPTVLEELVLEHAELINLRSKSMAHATPFAEEDAEHKSLRQQLARLTEFVMTGNDPGNNTSLGCEGLSADGNGNVTMSIGNRTWKRYSPMLQRLIEISTSL